jgi:hypothetical protein
MPKNGRRDRRDKTMNEHIKTHVTAYNEKHGYGTSDNDLIETIQEGKHIWTGDYDRHRWWNECFTVVEVGGMLIGFNDAETTGDESPYDRGWEFDPESICEVEAEAVVTTTTIYKRKITEKEG